MADIHIREAGIGDLKELLAWRAEVLREVFALVPEADMAELMRANRAYYEQTLGEGSHVACFAERKGETVGCGGVCLQREMPSPDNPSGRCGYLMNIYVRPAARRSGVAAEVVRWLVGKARDWGADKVYLETSVPGRPLYEGLGFVDLPDMMVLLQSR